MSLFGDVELDLRQAAVPTGEIDVKAVPPFGDIEVIVPNGISVELTGFSVFGRKKAQIKPPAGTPSPSERMFQPLTSPSARLPTWMH